MSHSAESCSRVCEKIGSLFFPTLGTVTEEQGLLHSSEASTNMTIVIATTEDRAKEKATFDEDR